jgi:hypothetical protein
MKRLLIIALFLASMAGFSAHAQVFGPCKSGFIAGGSNACSVAPIGGSGSDFALVGSGGTNASVSGGNVALNPSGNTHSVYALNWQNAVNVQAFTAEWTWIPNGWNMSFVIQNNTNTNSGPAGQSFFGGAGCEAALYQGFGTAPSQPNNIFGISFSQFDPLTPPSGTFSYSSVQLFQQTQDPCVGNPLGSSNFWGTQRISTSPVPLNLASGNGAGCTAGNGCNTTTGDLYDAKVVYDGTTVTLTLCDTTVNTTSCQSSCPTNCFTQAWSAVSVPSLVAGNTAFVGLMGSTNGSVTTTLQVNSFVYTVNSPPANPVLSTYTTQAYMGGGEAANPTFSPPAGTYTGTQTVTISCSTGSCYICYETSAGFPSVLPEVNNFGSNLPVGGSTFCGVGTHYAGPITVSSTENVYAQAGTTFTALPSSQVSAAFTINASAGSNSISSGVTATAGVTLP